MFNNMNGNENFNGGKPFFNNDQFNNPSMNNQFGTSQYDSQSNFLYGQNPKSTPELQDVPPSLDGIKNLDEAPRSEAPTMDALGPAPSLNAMNNPIQFPNDPLSSYENGTINLGETQNLNYQNSFPTNGNNMYGNFQSNYNSLTQMGANQFESTSFPQPQPIGNTQYNAYNTYMPNQQPTYGNQNSNFQGDFLNNVNYSSNPSGQYPNNIPSSSFNMTNNPSFSPLDNQFPFNNSQPSTLGQEPHDDIPISTLPPLPEVQPISENTLMEKDSKENPEKTLYNEKEPEAKDAASSDKPYDIINESVEKKDEKSADDELLELGIDDSYNEPDTLEIMDEEPTKQPVKLSEEDVTKIVDRFKSLTMELKKSGDKIELEEFDFEDMYQLIIKISKEKTE